MITILQTTTLIPIPIMIIRIKQSISFENKYIEYLFLLLAKLLINGSSGIEV